MSLLVCAATDAELAAFPEDGGLESIMRLVTGVGIPATFAGLRLPQGVPIPHLILNIGIAGAYPNSGIGIGDIVVADGEVYGDIGFELPAIPTGVPPGLPPGFQPIRESPFGAFYANALPTVQPPEWVKTDYPVHIARGCTVNACTGTDATGTLRALTFRAGFETMEGAAVAQIGREWGVPVCEIRAISNIAARRDMRIENIRLALANLRAYLAACLQSRRG